MHNRHATKWNVLENTTDYTKIIDLLLENRNINTKKEKEDFLNLTNPLLYLKQTSPEFKKSLIKTKNLIFEAINNDSTIIIHGDYDADGICATAILYNTIQKELGYKKCVYFLPNRFEHGYGLSKKSIDTSLKLTETEQQVLFITVDCGITSLKEVEYIKQLEHKIIITDHHQKPETLPKADCIVWNDKIVGASIAWILGKTLGSKDTQSIGLAALATVTDVQPLVEMNRAIVKYGLATLNKKPPVGIQKLLEIAEKDGTNLTTYDLGWVIGPRINAAGRIENASDAVKLLTDTDIGQLEQIAEKLNKINMDRQNKTMQMFELASQFDSTEIPKIIISKHKDYHEGIIGLVASRLVKNHYRPAIVISLDDTHGKGSVRSIPGINIIKLLRQFEELFVNLGGHPMAAGFTIELENIEILENKLLRAIEEVVGEEIFQPVLDIDLEIPLRLVNMELLELVNQLQPFGVGNKEPLFVSRDVGIVDFKIVGREKTHLSLKLFDGNKKHKGIFFGGAKHANNLTMGDSVDVVYSLRKNEFNGFMSVDLMVKDLVKPETP